MKRGPGRKTLQTSGGGGSGIGTIKPVKIKSGTGDTYVGDIYGNGKDAAVTEADVVVRVLQIDGGETIPVSTWLPAWQVKWSGTFIWTVDVARDY